MSDATMFIPFVPKAADGAAQTRNDFVRFCREELTVFGTTLHFDAVTWNASDYFRRRGAIERTPLNFTQFGGGSKDVGPPLPEPLGAFAKAYIRYIYGQKGRKSPPHREIDAFRVLAQALNEKGLAADIGLVDVDVLNHSMALALARWSKSTASSCGQRLEAIVKFLRTKQLTDCIHQPWKNGLKGHRVKSRISKDAEARRKSKLPSKEAMDAIPLAYELARKPHDVLLTSVLALLCCAPERVNEIFALPEKCEVEETLDGRPAFGIRWAGSKRYPDHVKLILGVMADVARGALKRLREHTDEARRIAGWYEANPGKLYLPADCAHLRGRDLTLSNITAIMGMRRITSAHAFLKRAAIECAGARCNPSKSGPGFQVNLYRFADVERAVVALLPAGFPILDPRTNLRYSQAMMVVRRGEFATDQNAWRCMIAPVTYMNIHKGLSRSADGRENMFDRLDLSTKEKPIFVTSHQIRHYLNTLANEADVSQVDLAAWSGRADIRQNREYDHETAESILERRRHMERHLAEVRASRGEASPPITIVPAAPVSRAEVATRDGHGHATEIGYCEHDFASAPCAMFMECLHCTKHVCIKGCDPNHTERIARALKEARRSLATAQKGFGLEYEGAEEWVQVHSETVQRLEQLHGILTDPTIPDGAKIRLSKSGRYTLIEQAMRDHELASGAHLLSPPDKKALPRAKKEPARA